MADIARAEDLAERALATAPRSSLAHFAKANVLRAQNRYQEAIPIVWYEKARNASPGHPMYHAFLAAAYALKGNTERAVAERAEARRLARDDRYSSITHSRAIAHWGHRKFAR